MLSASRTPTVPAFLLPTRDRREQAEKNASFNARFVDPWLVVCDRCPLEDCVLPEGGLHGHGGRWVAVAMELCPAERAKASGVTPAEVVGDGGKWGLRE